MNLFCIEDFKIEFEKLKSKKSYKTLETDIHNYFYKKTIDQLKSGTLLNANNEKPFLKKRLKGKGGFRIYYYLFIHKENIYLAFVHPKTGKFGSENIEEKYKAEIQKKVIQSIKENSAYLVKLGDNDTKISFQKQIVIELKE